MSYAEFQQALLDRKSKIEAARAELREAADNNTKKALLELIDIEQENLAHLLNWR